MVRETIQHKGRGLAKRNMKREYNIRNKKRKIIILGK